MVFPAGLSGVGSPPGTSLAAAARASSSFALERGVGRARHLEDDEELAVGAVAEVVLEDRPGPLGVGPGDREGVREQRAQAGRRVAAREEDDEPRLRARPSGTASRSASGASPAPRAPCGAGSPERGARRRTRCRRRRPRAPSAQRRYAGSAASPEDSTRLAPAGRSSRAAHRRARPSPPAKRQRSSYSRRPRSTKVIRSTSRSPSRVNASSYWRAAVPPTWTVRAATTFPWSSPASLAATPSSSFTAFCHSCGR